LNNKIVGSITKEGQLDHEWVELILEALEVGISVDEIKEFFAKKGCSTLSMK
jgi:DNA-binding transcriptional MerR regulator